MWIMLAVEFKKITATRVLIITTLLLIGGITILASTLVLTADAGNEQILAKMGEARDKQGWQRLTGVVFQIASAAGLLGYGVVLAWMFGREFTDRTIEVLLSLPVSRITIAAAKLLVYLTWTLIVATGITIATTLIGFTLGYSIPNLTDLAALARIFTLGILTGLIAIPVAWVATIGRGLLPGTATTIIMMASAQIVAIADGGPWYPVAAPAMWAMDPSSVQPYQLLMVLALGVSAITLTLLSWRQLQVDH